MVYGGILIWEYLPKMKIILSLLIYKLPPSRVAMVTDKDASEDDDDDEEEDVQGFLFKQLKYVLLKS